MVQNKEAISSQELIRGIVIERLKAMPQNVKITFGVSGQLLDKKRILDEINNNTAIGEKIIKIQLAYLQSFKEAAL